MQDTPPEVDERYRAMLMQRTGGERLMMGCAMCDTARALVEASLREQNPQATEGEIWKGCFSTSTSTNLTPRRATKLLPPSSEPRSPVLADRR